MIKAYKEGKDLYAVIGSKSFKVPYENCLEFHPVTHALQPDGKARRSDAKSILLGITYGMGEASLANRINRSVDEARQIIDDFYSGFKGVKKLTEDSQKMLKEKGYVTDMWGRRRHIPDAQLPDFTVKPMKDTSTTFNPLLGAIPHEDKLLQAKIKSYQDRLSKTKWKKEVDVISAQAAKEGLSVTNNKGFISRALRQCLNARIQGTAASMTKLAMVMVHNDPELKALGFRLLATVHDEMFGEAPRENSQRAGERLCEVMIEAAKTKCSVVPWKCDPYMVSRWYADEASGGVLNTYNKLVKSGMSEQDATLKLVNDYKFINAKYIEQMCSDTFDPNAHSDI